MCCRWSSVSDSRKNICRENTGPAYTSMGYLSLACMTRYCPVMGHYLVQCSLMLGHCRQLLYSRYAAHSLLHTIINSFNITPSPHMRLTPPAPPPQVSECDGKAHEMMLLKFGRVVDLEHLEHVFPPYLHHSLPLSLPLSLSLSHSLPPSLPHSLTSPCLPSKPQSVSAPASSNILTTSS